MVGVIAFRDGATPRKASDRGDLGWGWIGAAIAAGPTVQDVGSGIDLTTIRLFVVVAV